MSEALATQQHARVVDGMPFEEYAAVDALNGSSIVHMRRSPMFYRWMKDNPPPPTPALILGVAAHRLILEPDKVDDFAVWGAVPEHITESGRQRPRNGKDWEAFKAANAGKMLVTADECEAMVGIAVGARKNLPIRKYADMKGPTELSLFWTDTVTGRKMKCRLDKWIPQSRTVADLKTTRCCIPRVFAQQAFTLGYHVKMAIQWAGVKACMGVEPRLKLMAIESKPPHESVVFRITSDILLMGLEETDVLVKRIGECEKLGRWPAEQEEETDLLLPAWAIQTDANYDLIEGLELN